MASPKDSRFSGERVVRVVGERVGVRVERDVFAVGGKFSLSSVDGFVLVDTSKGSEVVRDDVRGLGNRSCMTIEEG